MATTSTNSHGGKHRSDPEIEKYRLELNWTKIRDKLKSGKVTGNISINLNDHISISKQKQNMENFWKEKLN